MSLIFHLGGHYAGIGPCLSLADEGSSMTFSLISFTAGLRVQSAASLIRAGKFLILGVDTSKLIALPLPLEIHSIFHISSHA